MKFWKSLAAAAGVLLLSALLCACEKTPVTIEEKKAFLYANGIALWDVIAACDILGSADSTIQNVTANEISEILQTANIREIYVNGKTAEKYFIKYTRDKVQRDAVCLPSTSPANAAWSLERLIDAWRVICEA